MKRAFIIIDIQNDYFEDGANPLPMAHEASLNAKLVLDDCRMKNVPVIHIQHISDREGATFFLPKTRGVEIHENVKPLTSEKVIEKHFPNSFRDTELHSYLKSLNIQELIICGMMTSMCVDATVRAAKDLGYTCYLIGDACAAPSLEYKGIIVSAENVHTAFLAGLNYFYSSVITTNEFFNK